MMKGMIWFTVAATALSVAIADGGLNVGDKAIDFSLKNIDGKMLSLSDLDNAKGAILVFTCNHCPFSVKYEDRLIALDKKYRSKGYPVVAINPNDAERYPEDNFENMIKRSHDKRFTFPYLHDETQKIAAAYGAARTPHVFVVQRDGGEWFVRYIGAIDDNSDNAKAVKEKYVERAVDALLVGKTVEPAFTKAIGCTIKWKK